MDGGRGGIKTCWIFYKSALHYPTARKSPMVWKCVCMSEREIEVWQLPQWVPQDFTSWVFNFESWPFHANCTNTDTHRSRVRKWKKYKTENGCYSSLLQQQTQTWELNVLFSLDEDQNAFYGCLYLLASLRWPSWCHKQLCFPWDYHQRAFIPNEKHTGAFQTGTAV